MAKAEVTFIVRARNATKMALRSAVKGFDKLAKNVVRLGKIAAVAFAGMVAGLIRAAKSAQDFNKQLGQIRTLSDIPMKELKKQVQDVSAEFGLAKEELTKGLYDALSAGVPKENAFDFLRTAAKAAIAGAGTTAEAVDLLTTSLNAFKIPASNAGKVADTLFTTVRLGKTTLSELSQSMAKVAPLANASGVSIEEVAAATATLTKQGTPTAEAMTQIRAALKAMNKELGDGWSATMTFNEAALEMANRAKGSQTALIAMTGRMEGAQAIMSLTGSNAEMAASDFDELTNAVGAADDAFNEMKDLNDLDKIFQTLNNILLTLGDSTLKGLAEEIDKLLEKTKELREDGKLEEWGNNAAKAINKVASAATSAITKIGNLAEDIARLQESTKTEKIQFGLDVLGEGGLGFTKFSKFENVPGLIGLASRFAKEYSEELDKTIALEDALTGRTEVKINKILKERAERKRLKEEKAKADAEEKARKAAIAKAEAEAAEAKKKAEAKRLAEERRVAEAEKRWAEAEKDYAKEKEKAQREEEERQKRILALKEQIANAEKEIAKQTKLDNIDRQIAGNEQRIRDILALDIPKREQDEVNKFFERRKEIEDVNKENAKRRAKIEELKERELKGLSITKRGRKLLEQDKAFKKAQRLADAERLAIKQLEARKLTIQRDIRGELQMLNAKLLQNLQAG